MNAPESLPLTRFLHEIPVAEVLAKKRWSREDWIVYALDAMEHGGLGAETRPDDRAGLLAVRSKAIDVVTTATVSTAMLYVAWTIDPLGTR